MRNRPGKDPDTERSGPPDAGQTRTMFDENLKKPRQSLLQLSLQVSLFSLARILHKEEAAKSRNLYNY
jgi:hypothetical protein